MYKRLSLWLVLVVAVLWPATAAFAGDAGYAPPPPPPTTHHGGGTFGVGTSWKYGTPGSHGSGTGSAATMCTAKDGTYGKVTAKPYTGTDHPPTPAGPGEWYQTFCGGHAGWVWWRGPA